MNDGPRERRKLTMKEVSQHNSEADCWLVVRGRVYDVTRWATVHPGGRAIYAFAGKDATDVFTTFHGPGAWKELASYAIGELADPEPLPALLKDFRDLRAKLQRQGLFKSSKLYYAFKLLGNVAILAASIALLVVGKGSIAFMIASALALGLFWQQSGWLAHDFLHHQVFADRRINDAMGLFLGNVCQGFSVDWWKSKHNLHHAAPNELSATKHAVDPDIDTLPLLAWSAEMLEVMGGKRHLIRIQQYLFFPVLCFARFNWAIGSLLHAWELAAKPGPKRRAGFGEVGLIAVHYAWHFGVAFAILPFAQALAYAALSQVVSGALLSIVFVQSHNGKDVYSAPKDFVTAQLVSTRDIDAGLWNDWFTGGLNFQIEHHLFPTMPRHNLAKVRAPVLELCRAHDLVFEERGMTESTWRVLKRLAEVAAHARTERPPASDASPGASTLG